MGLREISLVIETSHETVLDEAEDRLRVADAGLARLSEAISQRARLHLGARESKVERLAQGVGLVARGGLRAIGVELDHLGDGLGRDAARQVGRALDGLDCDPTAIADGSAALAESARRAIEADTRLVIGMGPGATLRHGFAMARDEEGRPVTSREAATRLPTFQVEFHDGPVPVSDRQHEGGARR